MSAPVRLSGFTGVRVIVPPKKVIAPPVQKFSSGLVTTKQLHDYGNTEDPKKYVEIAGSYNPEYESDYRRKTWDESQHPRDPSGTHTGGQFTSSEAASGDLDLELPLRPSKARAFNGKSVELETKLTKRQTGKLGEDLITVYLRSKGLEDARALNTRQENFPVDLVQDHELIEVKTGLVSNGSDAQKWRATIGQPGPNERAWLRAASAEDKREWNQQKSADILERKAAALKDYEKQSGVKAKGKTITAIIDPDRKIVDIYEFDGFHLLIRWNSKVAESGYVGSYSYAGS